MDPDVFNKYDMTTRKFDTSHLAIFTQRSKVLFIAIIVCDD